MRLLGVLALAAPLAFGILVLVDPRVFAPWIEEGLRPGFVASAAGAAGVILTALLVAAYFRFRFGTLVTAAERIAGGDYTTTVVPRTGGLEGRLAHAVNDIAGALADTHDRATIDRLTGVNNRQVLLADLFAEIERATRYERPLSVAFVDIDHFKAVNDTYGHGAGDIVLRGVAQTIAANLRTSDMIGRYGGEEFMLILTETGVEEGSVLTEKLRTLVQRQRFMVDAGQESRSRSRSASLAVSANSCAWRRWCATRTPPCIRPSPWDATRPTSSPSPTTMPVCHAPRSRPMVGRGRWRSGSRRVMRPRPP